MNGGKIKLNIKKVVSNFIIYFCALHIYLILKLMIIL